MTFALWVLYSAFFTLGYIIAFGLAFFVISGVSNTRWLAPDAWSGDVNRMFLYVTFGLAMLSAAVAVKATKEMK